ncbi:ribosomal protein S18-alanine N-acetyltransferase [Ethanoligenens harbinense]|uniref:[Ribosomal protein bS18]-alanine N-acetyltransferase n=1 Tax=Ethanoligenens harbinense (strain DSM 18485 / JCM 12961 / CGMCC 1.5033 / YUAN-3) TaxID=663278 RepID=E6U758_ETHHY|nr:ribosomal protein S18-alanine N-acetyltransferase [Ethanoligenens harbinense]ADU28128.1 ribosomal-protein-alanine acetyltransferase [Ethanoligenens harbinense YUAN-3]AVQ97134.1 ribosomal-protein-alanine N-acetyltransferase [Ethanoligenens harbinense YUAN-3]AYF39797.1 ribosomal-protein-alanine N-acetyltransferase [Ethanoligenens harbinense]AYF42629.1 ribosomal-protein-alanine N-acetyltransferase [Ethanoligenens harbinense]QCN93378.1 ribosomal-protein-alanine N-acetyltransferase [Ethanoligene
MSAAPFDILPMEERHLNAAAALERICFGDPWSREAFGEELRNPSARFLVAERDGVLAGYAGMSFVLDEGYVFNIAVAPAFRRQGAARALLTALDRFAQEKGLAFLSLEVRVSNTVAIALYRSFGFRMMGVRPGFYAHPPENAYIMTKPYRP